MTADIKCLVIFLLLHKYETLCHWKSNVLLSYMTNIPLYVFLFFVQTCLADDRGIRRITRKVPHDTSEHIGRFLTINRSSRRTKAPRSGANKKNEEGQDYWTIEDGKQVFMELGASQAGSTLQSDSCVQHKLHTSNSHRLMNTLFINSTRNQPMGRGVS